MFFKYLILVKIFFVLFALSVERFFLEVFYIVWLEVFQGSRECVGQVLGGDYLVGENRVFKFIVDVAFLCDFESYEFFLSLSSELKEEFGCEQLNLFNFMFFLN